MSSQIRVLIEFASSDTPDQAVIRLEQVETVVPLAVEASRDEMTLLHAALDRIVSDLRSRARSQIEDVITFAERNP